MIRICVLPNCYNPSLGERDTLMPRVFRSKPELLRLLELLSPVDRRVMAQLWDAPSPDAATLAAIMADPDRVQSQWSRLTDAERAALARLIEDDGALPVAVMQREWGGVREPSGFEHPRAYLDALRGPTTPTERLYNLGFIFRAHDERGAIYRIPNDLRPLLPDVPPRDRTLHVVAAAEPPSIESGSPEQAERLIVALLTLAYSGELKALDDGAINKPGLVKIARSLPFAPDLRSIRREAEWPFMAVLRAAAMETGLLRRAASGELRPTAQALDWLKAPRAERMRRLLDGWCTSSLDDLTVLCGLRWKGGAPYTLNRTATRRNLLGLLATLPTATWLPIDRVVAAIHHVEPDFQRRDGRYDTWLLYDADDRLVSSWEDWRLVEGALIKAVLRGPLHWLGLIDLDAVQDEQSGVVRINPLGAHLLMDAEEPPEATPSPLIVQSTFEVVCPPGAVLYAQFQLARFAEPQQNDALAIYKLTRRALLAAAERGISAPDIVHFLEAYGAGPLPPAVAYTLLEWGGQAEQVRLEDAVLLHAADPIVLAQIRNNRALGLEDVEPLTPTLLRVPYGTADELAEQLRRAGFGLRDERIDPQMPLDERDLKALVTGAVAYARICAELDLPCDLSPALLQRLIRLVPPRSVDLAQESADAVVQQLAERQRNA